MFWEKDIAVDLVYTAEVKYCKNSPNGEINLI